MEEVEEAAPVTVAVLAEVLAEVLAAVLATALAILDPRQIKAMLICRAKAKKAVPPVRLLAHPAPAVRADRRVPLEALQQAVPWKVHPTLPQHQLLLQYPALRLLIEAVTSTVHTRSCCIIVLMKGMLIRI